MDHKKRITAAFAAAAGTYEASAGVQALVADRLAEQVRMRPLPPSPQVLEIGCGTGLLTRRLMPAIGGQWLVTDIAASMVEAARAVCPRDCAVFRAMDGEHPDVAEASQDLIVSNLAAQWFTDAKTAFSALARCLKPGGRMLITTLGPQSFKEWRAIHADLGLTCGTRAYPTEITDLAGAEVIAEEIPVRYSDGRTFLGQLKAIGAGTPTPTHRPLGPGELRRVLSRLGAPCTITYEVMTLDYTRPAP